MVLSFALKYSISRELADKPQDKDRMTNIISTYLVGPSLCVANSHRGSGNARIRAYTNQNLIRKLSRRSHFKWSFEAHNLDSHLNQSLGFAQGFVYTADKELTLQPVYVGTSNDNPACLKVHRYISGFWGTRFTQCREMLALKFNCMIGWD